MPTLNESDKSVLLAMQHAGVATGRQLMAGGSMTAEELSAVASRLMDMGLISANANIINAKEISQVYFNIQPSGIQYADTVLNAR